MAEKETECLVASRCIYSGSGISGKACLCNYIGHTGKSRVHNDPKGKIVDGKCGYFEELPDEGKRLRGKNAWDRTF